jgi:hypothetical protein
MAIASQFANLEGPERFLRLELLETTPTHSPMQIVEGGLARVA